MLQKIIAFRLGKEEFGIAMDSVISIERVQSITGIPHTSEYIRGIIDLRGDLIPILDLRKYLLEGNVSDNEQNRIIVVQVNATVVGFIVDEATDILPVSEADIVQVPVSGMKITGETTVIKLDERLLLYIDVERLFMNTDIAEAVKKAKQLLA
jgi:purine-binding chemotaxis protein CheW